MFCLKTYLNDLNKGFPQLQYYFNLFYKFAYFLLVPLEIRPLLIINKLFTFSYCFCTSFLRFFLCFSIVAIVNRPETYKFI